MAGLLGAKHQPRLAAVRWQLYRSVIVLICLVWFPISGNSQSSVVAIRQPIALDFLPSVGLVVLGLDGTVIILKPEQNFREVASFHLPFNERPADMTLAQIHGTIFIIVSSNKTQTSVGSPTGGVITQYSLDGKSKRVWFTHGLSSGIDYEENSRNIYFATSDENAIYTISVDGGGSSPKYFATISSITQVGPIAIDLPNQSIWCGDAADGGIYGLSLSTKKTSLGSRTVGPVTGLFWDRATQRLYATDARRKTVAVLSRQGSTLTVQSTIRLERTPTAVSTVGNGTIAIADQEGNSVLLFGANGSLIQTLTGHQ